MPFFTKFKFDPLFISVLKEAETPESTGLADIAEDIVESTGVTCTDAEKEALAAQVAPLEALIEKAEEALEAIQAALLEITGSTAAIVTTPLVAVTTAASRMRMRGLKIKV